jgi:hypothetical protein
VSTGTERLERIFRPTLYPTGLSSEAIAGTSGHRLRDHPHDPADLVRCVNYLAGNNIDTEGLRQRVAHRSIAWSRLVAEWDRLVALLRHEVETSVDDRAPLTYREMKRVIADGVPCAVCDGTGRADTCEKCKGTGRRSGGKCRAIRCYDGADYCHPCRGRGFTSSADD